MGYERSVRIVESPEELAAVGAEEFARRAAEAVAARGVFTVCLAGGSTPQGIYSRLAEEPQLREQVPWDKCHFFFGDERHVPADHPDNNYRMAYYSLLSRIPAPPWNAHRWATELPDAGQAADHYEGILKEFFHLAPGQRPRFDLVFLGLGSDGHTASLFPGSEALKETSRPVAAPWVEKLKAHRVTLTPPVFNQAAAVIFLVSGAEKVEALREAVEGSGDPGRFPARLIRPTDGTLLYLADREAGRLLRKES